MRVKYILIGIIIGLLFSVTALVLAGNLDPAVGPAQPGSQLYTLEDVYNQLDAGTAGTKMTAFTEPLAGPGSSGHTLDEVLAIAPAVDEPAGAVAADVASGKTFWGLTAGEWGLLAGSGLTVTHPAPLPKTGQTQLYRPHDDGDLEKGVAWPNPRFTDNLDGTVTDNLTGLVWLKNANCAGMTIDWDTGIDYSAALYDGCTDCFGGSSDCGLSDNSVAGAWRLPNLSELESLIHRGVWNPAIPNTAGTGQWAEGDPFNSVLTITYWSSTTYIGNIGRAWYVLLESSKADTDVKLQTNAVWPVRDGQ